MTHSNILPETAIDSIRRIFGSEVKEIIPVDENGNEIESQTSISRESVAFEAMKKRAQALKIKGWQRMSEETLLKAIQTASIN